MKNRFKIAVLTLLIASSFNSSAQSFNISGGMNLSSFSFYEDGERLYQDGTEEFGSYTSKTEIKWNTGFNASLGYEFKLSELLSLETGLSYSTKGFTMVEKVDYVWASGSETAINKDQVRINYLDLPLTLNAGFNAGNFRLYGKAGGFVGFGMLGNVKSSYESSDSDGYEYTEESRYGLDLEDGDERINYGFIAGIGTEYKNLFLEFKYSAGRVVLGYDDDYKINSHNFGLSIGYKFKKVSEVSE